MSALMGRLGRASGRASRMSPATVDCLLSDAALEIRTLRRYLGAVILECANFHHSDADLHSMADPCPIVARLRSYK